MDADKMIKDLQSIKMYYDASLSKCQSVGHSIMKDTRTRCGWNQKQLASFLNCSDGYVSKIENKHYKITLDILLKLGEIIEELEDIDNDFKE